MPEAKLATALFTYARSERQDKHDFCVGTWPHMVGYGP